MCSHAGEADTPQNAEGSAELGNEIRGIFEEILGSLPCDLKALVDSAASSGETASKTKSGKDSGESSDSITETGERAEHATLLELPEELRRQVEKRITEIENKQTERALQFRDSRESRKAGAGK